MERDDWLGSWVWGGFIAVIAIGYIVLAFMTSVRGRTLGEVVSLNQHWGMNGVIPNSMEMSRYLDTGIRVFRTGFDWSRVEMEKGVYNWTFYDRFFDFMATRGQKGLFCTHFTTELYNTTGGMPRDDESRSAAAEFLAAAGMRYKAHPALLTFEITNEPNLMKEINDTAAVYGALVRAIGEKFRGNASLADVHLSGPASAGASQKVSQGFPWLKMVFAEGILEVVDWVTVHLYTYDAPETTVAVMEEVQKLINASTTRNPPPKVASGEFGYPTCTGGCRRPVSEETQAKYLARMMLWQWANGCEYSNWYEFYSGCTDPTNRECRFGVVRNGAPYSPKPAFYALQTMLRTMANASSSSFLNATSDSLPPNATIATILAQNTSTPIITTWININSNNTNTHPTPASITLPTDSFKPNTCFQATYLNGSAAPSTCATNQNLKVFITDAPIFLTLKN